ncbi:hypothetical protein WJX72_009004 [[Myrmecia] bisecta]|uniref:Uncharacterized protein n=1 Tax=[Myrmecia] bisecta TaxID=41462 RepID=A0AAW1Q9X2_9CHLO
MLQGTLHVKPTGAHPTSRLLAAGGRSGPAQLDAPKCELCIVYDNLADTFGKGGLSLPSVTDISSKFDIQEGLATPLRYSELRLAPSAVRLVVAPLTAAPSMVEQAVEVSDSIRRIIPTGYVVLENDPSLFHVTLFHTSQAFDPRPDPFDPSPDLSTDPQSRPVITPQLLDHELQTVHGLAASVGPINLEVYRVVFADSGTLLLCSIDRSGQLTRLRQQLRASFPGASTKQTSTMHVSLLRVLTPQQLSPDVIRDIQEACDTWTERLRGRTFTLDRLWHIREHIFAAVTGKRVEIRLAEPQVATFR